MEFFVLRKAFVFTVMLNFKHYPVLLKEAIDLLNIKPDGIYVDGTTGGGGHSYEILKKLSLKGTLICILSVIAVFKIKISATYLIIISGILGALLSL